MAVLLARCGWLSDCFSYHAGFLVWLSWLVGVLLSCLVGCLVG